MNLQCRRFTLSGEVLDLGSGEAIASYHRFFGKESARIASLDGRHQHINFEKDALPYTEGSMDTVLAFNIFEHVYRYTFLLGEIRRILKEGGQVVGAVPFLVGYHADPRDYFRYTNEALECIFEEAGFTDIRVTHIGYGPFSAGYAQVEFMMPRVLKMLLLPCALLFDRLIFFLKPNLDRKKFALGFFFSMSK